MGKESWIFWKFDMKNVMVNIGLLFGSMLIAFIVIEIGFEIFSPQKAAFPKMYQSDKELGFVMQSNKTFRHWDYKIDTHYHLGEYGNRTHSGNDRIVLEKESILLLGDSFTFGQGVEYPYTFCGLMENEFKEYQIINTAVPGWGLEQYLIILKRYIKLGLNIQYAIIGYFPFNDISDLKRDYKAIRISDGRIIKGTPNFMNRINTFIVSNSHTLTFLYRLWVSNKVKKHYDILSPTSRAGKLFSGDTTQFRIYAGEAQQCIEDIATICKKYDISLLVLIIPSEHGFTIRKTYKVNIDYSFPTRVIHWDLSRKGIDSVDLRPYMNENTFIPKDTHFNKEGHQIVAQIVKKHLKMVK